jgi:hypothetical protein
MYCHVSMLNRIRMCRNQKSMKILLRHVPL